MAVTADDGNLYMVKKNVIKNNTIPNTTLYLDIVSGNDPCTNAIGDVMYKTSITEHRIIEPYKNDVIVFVSGIMTKYTMNRINNKIP
jgi:predicted transcriptional regulator